MNSKPIKRVKNQGFNLIELMISMAIGSFLLAGVFTVYFNSSKTQRLVEDQVALMDDARFALDTIAYDLRHAGIMGRRGMYNYTLFNNSEIAGISNECVAGWATNVTYTPATPIEAIRAFNDTTPYLATCTPNWSQGDVIEMRYSYGVPVTTLLPNTLYVNASINEAQFFIGNASPNLPNALDFQVVGHVYYISNFTEPGDGIPSLHRVSLQSGPTGPRMVDEMLLSGVVDLQVQFGIALDDSGQDKNLDANNLTLDAYVNPGHPNATAERVLFTQFWLVLQSTEYEPNVDTTVTYNMAGLDKTFNNDGYRKVMLSTVVKSRNLN